MQLHRLSREIALPGPAFISFRIGSLILALVFALPGTAAAQRAAENAVRSTEDAFGTSIGNESIGLYGPGQVRGFSPVAAGNVRMEGLYMDRQGFISQRLVSGSSVSVGLSAQGYAFPAPTGIVDYRLRPAGNERIVSIVTGSLAYGAPTLEVDAQLPVIADELSVAAGLSWAHEEYFDGSDAPYFRAAVIPRWRPLENLEIIPFWSLTEGRNEQVAPTIVMANSATPPEAPRRRYFGQDWAAKNSRSNNSGVIVKAALGDSWDLAAGAFHSVFVNEENFAELFVDTHRPA